jgi:hypothetical protein
MGKPGQSGKFDNNHIDSLIKPLTIYRNDPRNNADFLKKHPNTIVINKNSPHPVKKVGEHGSVSSHHPRSRTQTIHPKTAHPAPRSRAAGVVAPTIAVNHPDDAALEDPTVLEDLETEEGQSEQTDESGAKKFLFHELVGEEYDPAVDLDVRNDQEAVPAYDGAIVDHLPDIIPPVNISIDPNSFVLQADARDGTVSFKASVVFDDDDFPLDDYDIIVTQVTTT